MANKTYDRLYKIDLIHKTNKMKYTSKLILNWTEYEFGAVWGWEWQPDPSRTIFYYDFEQNTNDSSWNWNNITGSYNITYSQVWWQYVVVAWNNPSVSTDPSYSASIGTWDFAISFWIYPVHSSTNTPMMFGIFSWDRPDYAWPTIFMDTDKTMLVRMTASDQQQTSETLTMNTWQHIVMTRNSWTVKFYLDSTEILSWSDNTSFAQNHMFAYIFSRWDSSQRFYSWAMWDKFILENVAWTAQDVVDYFNSTKSLYWVS